MLLLITAVHNVITISSTVHHAAIVYHHFVGSARVRAQSRPALVLRVSWVGTARHVLVACVLFINLVQILHIVKHL